MNHCYNGNFLRVVFGRAKEGFKLKTAKRKTLDFKNVLAQCFALLLNYVAMVVLIKNMSLCACAFDCVCV